MCASCAAAAQSDHNFDNSLKPSRTFVKVQTSNLLPVKEHVSYCSN